MTLRNMMMAIGGGASGALAFTAITAFDIDATSAQAGFRFQNDGSIDRNQGGSFSQVNAGEWWTNEPEASIGDDFEVRYTGGGGVWTLTEAAGATVWIAMTAARTWSAIRNVVGVSNFARTFEIGDVGTSVADVSASLTIDIEVF